MVDGDSEIADAAFSSFVVAIAEAAASDFGYYFVESAFGLALHWGTSSYAAPSVAASGTDGEVLVPDDSSQDGGIGTGSHH